MRMGREKMHKVNCKIAVLVMLLFGMPVMAQLSTLIEAVEVSPSVINLPTSPNGNLRFQPCEERCKADYISVRLTSSTRFVIQGEVVTFADFRKAFYNKRRSADGYALITFDTNKHTATSVEVSY